MRIKANFNASQALEYMMGGGKLYLEGWEYTYQESLVFDYLSPIVMTPGDSEVAAARDIWNNLYAVERDESEVEASARIAFGAVSSPAYREAQEIKNKELKEIADNLRTAYENIEKFEKWEERRLQRRGRKKHEPSCRDSMRTASEITGHAIDGGTPYINGWECRLYESKRDAGCNAEALKKMISDSCLKNTENMEANKESDAAFYYGAPVGKVELKPRDPEAEKAVLEAKLDCAETFIADLKNLLYAALKK